MSIFGSDIAQNDSLLDECYVPINNRTEQASILTGRWGTGKTAILFHRTKSIRLVLNQFTEKELWYIGEDSLNINALIDANDIFKNENRKRKKAFEDIWKAEITRVFCILLYNLRNCYDNTEGKHWKHVFNLAKTDLFRYSLWVNLSEALNVLLNDKQKKIKKIQGTIEDIFSDYTLDQVKLCLRDLGNHPQSPIVAIEPIDSPNSSLAQEEHLAQDVVTSLLETFIRHFSPKSHTKSSVLIAIPWHRIKEEDLIFPQRFSEHIHYVSWTKDDLRKFINSRIEWEFKRVGRNFTAGVIDAWRKLFENKIVSEYYQHPYAEESFEYLLRHTNYRARDILRLARAILTDAAIKLKVPDDHILLGRGGYSIDDKTFRNTISKEIPKLLNERKIEAERKYPDILNILKYLNGIKVPFDSEELNRRYKNTEYSIDDIIKTLWYSGFLGLKLCPKNNKAKNSLEHSLECGNSTFISYDIAGRHRAENFYLFEYNINSDPIDLISKHQDDNDVEFNYILHPVMYYGTSYNISKESPLGI